MKSCVFWQAFDQAWLFMFLLQEVERQSQADLEALQERGLSGQ
jgi:hypothetical protein